MCAVAATLNGMRAVLTLVLAGSILIGGTPPQGGPPTVTAQPVVVAQPAGVAPRGTFGWPLPGVPTVLRRFDPPENPYGAGHRGVDLGGWDGEPVLAAGDGVVAFAGMVAGRPVVSVDHPNGLRTTYEPVLATVSPGQRVTRGQPIGTLQAGHAGCVAAACLHWGVRRGDEYLDPLGLLSAGRVRLLLTDPAPVRWTPSR